MARVLSTVDSKNTLLKIKRMLSTEVSKIIATEDRKNAIYWRKQEYSPLNKTRILSTENDKNAQKSTKDGKEGFTLKIKVMLSTKK